MVRVEFRSVFMVTTKNKNEKASALVWCALVCPSLARTLVTKYMSPLIT